MAKEKAKEVSLTKAIVENFTPPATGRAVIYDSKVRGLMLRVTPSGVRSFYVYKKLGGRPLKVLIAHWPQLTIEQVRKAAVDKITQILNGANPNQEKGRLRASATLQQLFTHWVENHAKPHKKTWREDERQYNVYLAAWKNRRLSDITMADVQGLCARIGEKHGKYAANRVLSLLRAAFNEAAKIGYHGANPATGIRRFKEESRDRFLQPDELPRFFTAVANEPNPVLRDFFLLALFTGGRRSNVCAMRWDQLDMKRAEWRIPETKSGRPQIVYLPEPALRILAERKKNSGRCPWVLPSRGKLGHLAEPKVAWKRLIERAGIENLRVHDLRRTLGSYQAIQGASLSIIGASLGHSQAQTTKVYARLTTNTVADSVGKAVDFIIASSKPEGGTDGEA